MCKVRDEYIRCAHIPLSHMMPWQCEFHFLLFWPCYMACGILAAPPGIKPLQWEGGVLPTGLQGKSCSVSLQKLYI